MNNQIDFSKLAGLSSGKKQLSRAEKEEEKTKRELEKKKKKVSPAPQYKPQRNTQKPSAQTSAHRSNQKAVSAIAFVKSDRKNAPVFTVDGDTYSGHMTATITLKSPLLAINGSDKMDQENRAAAEQRKAAPIIPASSLKGMLRNAAEMLWGQAYVNDNTSIDSLRLVEKLFGYTRQNTTASHISAIRLTDAFLTSAQENKGNKAYINQRFGPKKDMTNSSSDVSIHKVYISGTLRDIKKYAFMTEQPTGSLNYYFNRTQEPDKYTPVYVTHDGATYQFTLYFTALTKKEITLLIRLLELSEACGNANHSIGRGKALGFGRISIEVDNTISIQNAANLLLLNKSLVCDSSFDKKALLQQFENPFLAYFKTFMRFASASPKNGAKNYYSKNTAKSVEPYKTYENGKN